MNPKEIDEKLDAVWEMLKGLSSQEKIEVLRKMDRWVRDKRLNVVLKR